MAVTIKTPEEQDAMRLAGKLAADVLDMITDYVKPGVSTNELNDVCHRYITETQQAIPAPLNYTGGGPVPFPKSICTSLNHVICHGIPSDRVLRHGDALNIDVTVIKDGWHGDTSRMFMVGKPNIQAQRIAKICHEAMMLGIQQVAPGRTLGDIGHVIQRHAERNRCAVVREYCGHGIGRGFHEDPQIVHFGKPGTGMTLEAGMTFTIEPMLNAGKRHTRLLPDGWTVVTRDHSLSVQWEHTVLGTPTGYEILTLGEAQRDRASAA